MRLNKVVNQYGKIISGDDRGKILDAHNKSILGVGDEIILDKGKVKLVSIIEQKYEVIYNVEVTVF